MAEATQWHMRGDVMEACSCTVACPCNFGGDPTQVPCEAVIGWRIQEGRYGQTRLDGLNVVLYLSIPGNVFEGNITAGAYLDERADPRQAEALGAVFSGQAGGWPAAISPLIANPLPPKQVPIEFEAVAGGHRIRVPGLLEAEAESVPHPLPDQPPLDTKVTDLVVPFYTGPASVRRSKALRLTDPAMRFEHPGRSSLVGQFEYSGP